MPLPYSPLDRLDDEPLAPSRSRRDVAVVACLSLLGLALAGATAFGLVHIVGGALRGNPRAVGFGVALAGLSGGALVAGVAAVRRLAGR